MLEEFNRLSPAQRAQILRDVSLREFADSEAARDKLKKAKAACAAAEQARVAAQTKHDAGLAALQSKYDTGVATLRAALDAGAAALRPPLEEACLKFKQASDAVGPAAEAVRTATRVLAAADAARSA